MSDQEIPVEIRKQLLEEELARWRNTRYLFEVRYKVAQRIGDGPEVLAGYRAELERCERAIDALGEELAGVAI